LSRAQRLSPEAHCTIQAPNDVAKTAPSVARRIATTVAVAAAGMLTGRFLTQYPSQFTHAQAERIGSRSGRRNSDRTASSPWRKSDRAVRSGFGPDARPREAPNTRRIQASEDAADGSESARTATRRLSPRAARSSEQA
jgi:hypothetical protein